MAHVMSRAWREEPLDEKEYGRQVAECRNSTVFHDPTWLRIVSEMTPEGIQILRVYDGHEIVAVLPHVHRKVGAVRAMLSPPSGLGIQYLGPLFPGIEDLKQDKRERRLSLFATAVVDHGRQTKSRLVHLRMAPGFEDARHFLWSGFSVLPRYTYELDLRHGA